MSAESFLNEWISKYSHLDMTAREVAYSFNITSSKAAAMLNKFVKSGECVSRYYTASRVTVYTLKS